MADQDSEPINLEPDNEAAPPPVSGPFPTLRAGRPLGSTDGDIPPTGGEPIDIEDDRPPSQRSIHELDVCPSCSAPMRGADTLVCIRCGFDLKSMRKAETVVGRPTEALLDSGDDSREILVKPGRGDLWLPTAMAGVSAVILLIAYLSAWRGLFPGIDAAAAAGDSAYQVSVGDRMRGVLQFAVLALMWTACGVAAVAMLAHLLGLKLGDMKLSAVRMLGIVTTMRLAAMLNVPYPWLEWTAEAVIQIATFIGLSIVLFRLPPRDAPTLAGIGIVMFVLLWLLAHLIVFVAG